MANWYSGIIGIHLRVKRADAREASHSGQCDSDVEAVAERPYLAAQLAAVDQEEVITELREYGAWSEEELADHDQNIKRLLWLACGDIVDGRC